ncbi:MAG: copper chaperone PCu(A)C [Pararhodobacter sp.]|nr:copper chaperone PCu(A)C [Pararhodobacter sp.]
MFRTLPIAAAAALLAMPALACDGFEADDAYARAATAMSQSGAAFMVLRNQGDSDCRITGARSDVAQRVELHTHIEDEQGVMRMVEIEGGIALPANGEHALERGGDHVMFLGLNRPLEQGDVIALTLIFEDGAEVALEVPVDNERQPMGHGHSHGHGHGND